MQCSGALQQCCPCVIDHTCHWLGTVAQTTTQVQWSLQSNKMVSKSHSNGTKASNEKKAICFIFHGNAVILSQRERQWCHMHRPLQIFTIQHHWNTREWLSCKDDNITITVCFFNCFLKLNQLLTSLLCFLAKIWIHKIDDPLLCTIVEQLIFNNGFKSAQSQQHKESWH